jgi:non-ribosomal peptide synthetase component E (peptide arylation enzyme)
MSLISRYTSEMTASYVRDGHWTADRTMDFWLRNVDRQPDALALEDDSQSFSWAEGMRAINAIANGLVEAGIPRDGVLLTQGYNSALYVLLRVACEQAGIVLAFLHAGFRRAEIVAVASTVRPVGAVVASNGKPELLATYQSLADELGLKHFFTFTPEMDAVPSIADFANRPAGPVAASRQIRPFEMTGIVTSSGTTGLPKCIEYSCWPRLASGRVYIDRLKITAQDVILTCIPFYTGGGDMQFHAAPQAGARYIVQPHFSPEATCGLIESKRVTGAVMVPTMISRILSLPNVRDFDLSSLRWVVSGGSMLPYDIGARFEDLTGARIIQGYGLMDCGALSSHGIDDSRELRLTSSGWVMPGSQYRVLDASGAELPPGETGELCVAGAHCNGGYIGANDEMKRSWSDGFFRTGDLGCVTAEGLLVLQGRSKDIIIRGGQNISAYEVESVLCRHQAVAQAALVRMADPDLGERACAFISLGPKAHLDFAEMVAFLKSCHLAHYKIPERLEIIDHFPMTPAGNKVDKRALEARLQVGTQQRAGAEKKLEDMSDADAQSV